MSNETVTAEEMQRALATLGRVLENRELPGAALQDVFVLARRIHDARGAPLAGYRARMSTPASSGYRPAWDEMLELQRAWMFRRFDEGLSVAWVCERIAPTVPGHIVVAYKHEGRWKYRAQNSTGSVACTDLEWVHTQLNNACGFVDPDRAWP